MGEEIQREGMYVYSLHILSLLPHTPSHFTPYTPSHPTPPHTPHPTPHTHPSQSASEGDTTIAMDHGLHHHERLQEANRGLDNILNHGRDIVENLKNQGFTLKAS